MGRLLNVFIAVVALVAKPVSSQDVTEGKVEAWKPIENTEFYGVTQRSKVTRRFEIYDPHSVEDLQAVRDMGFDQVILDHPNLHSHATELGLDVVLANWWHQETPQSAIDETYQLATEVAPGKLKAISIQDEPERNSPDTPFSYYVELYKKLKPRMVDKLAQTRLEISYWGPLSSWDQRYYEYFSYLYESADAMRIMPYPDLHEAPLSEVYLMMQRSKRAMQLADVDIPQIVILQTWVLPPEDKLPTIAELRVMAYQAMLGGAEAISFFEYNPALWQKTAGFTAGFRELMAELRGLSQRLSGAELETVLHSNGIFECTAVWPSGGTALVRVNTNRETMADMLALQIDDSSRVANEDLSKPEASQTSIVMAPGAMASPQSSLGECRVCWLKSDGPQCEPVTARRLRVFSRGGLRIRH